MGQETWTHTAMPARYDGGALNRDRGSGRCTHAVVPWSLPVTATTRGLRPYPSLGWPSGSCRGQLCRQPGSGQGGADPAQCARGGCLDRRHPQQGDHGRRGCSSPRTMFTWLTRHAGHSSRQHSPGGAHRAATPRHATRAHHTAYHARGQAHRRPEAHAATPRSHATHIGHARVGAGPTTAGTTASNPQGRHAPSRAATHRQMQLHLLKHQASASTCARIWHAKQPGRQNNPSQHARRAPRQHPLTHRHAVRCSRPAARRQGHASPDCLAHDGKHDGKRDGKHDRQPRVQVLVHRHTLVGQRHTHTHTVRHAHATALPRSRTRPRPLSD